MKRIFFLLIVMGLGLSTAAMAMSRGQVCRKTRFLTDKMAYELNLSTRQYEDVYEINYDFIDAVCPIMDKVVRGYEWAVDDYYEALDIRNDDLRWVLSERQYLRLVGMDYFYRPIYVRKEDWTFRIYIYYPDRNRFYFGIPHHCHTYCGVHYRSHFHRVSYYKGRYADLHHCHASYRIRSHRFYHSCRYSDFGTVRFLPHSSVRPQHESVSSLVATRLSAPVHSKVTARLDRSHRRQSVNVQTVSHRRSLENTVRRNAVLFERSDKRASSESVRRGYREVSRSSERNRTRD
ncbi:hypothetical protein, secreted [gut metagenome]|uniref:Uncharacterized protein n=1 Tax=gut metagenome TaxID=749906 RepID=J9GRG2_9ZZZZ